MNEYQVFRTQNNSNAIDVPNSISAKEIQSLQNTCKGPDKAAEILTCILEIQILKIGNKVLIELLHVQKCTVLQLVERYK